jgi:hypothetical protein
MEMYKQNHPDAKVSSVGLGRALANAGFPQVCDGQPIRGPDGRQGRFFAVRNVGKWRKASRKEAEKNVSLPAISQRGKK